MCKSSRARTHARENKTIQEPEDLSSAAMHLWYVAVTYALFTGQQDTDLICNSNVDAIWCEHLIRAGRAP